MGLPRSRGGTGKGRMVGAWLRFGGLRHHWQIAAITAKFEVRIQMVERVAGRGRRGRRERGHRAIPSASGL